MLSTRAVSAGRRAGGCLRLPASPAMQSTRLRAAPRRAPPQSIAPAEHRLQLARSCARRGSRRRRRRSARRRRGRHRAIRVGRTIVAGSRRATRAAFAGVSITAAIAATAVSGVAASRAVTSLTAATTPCLGLIGQDKSRHEGSHQNRQAENLSSRHYPTPLRQNLGPVNRLPATVKRGRRQFVQGGVALLVPVDWKDWI